MSDRPLFFPHSSDQLQRRIHWLPRLYSHVQPIWEQQLGQSTSAIALLSDLWLPLAFQIADWRQMAEQPVIVGLLGGQGTGKTTLTRMLSVILTQLGLRVCCLSIDDLYKTYADRQQLQHSDPRLRWRGPPGTHDVELGLSVLQQLRQASDQHPVAVPRFDKSLHQGAGDRAQPDWVTTTDVVLFEGWFVGVPPVAPELLAQAPAPIETGADRSFAQDCNQRLQAYVPLWQELDRLVLLDPVDYRLSQQWRQQAEQQMKATGKTGMSDSEIADFVTYFWKALHPEIFIWPLRQDDQRVDLVIELDSTHLPIAIYPPGGR